MTEAEIRAERILDGMQAIRDMQILREMNGKKCGGRQQSSLLRLNAPGYRIENERTVTARRKRKPSPTDL